MRYQREVRLGLVLYGGVSLAIYENGIAQEIYRAVCGNGIYGLVSELVDSDIVVDIISGTSAGGDNGIMLAYSLAHKSDFTKSAELWRHDGDINSLLRNQKDPNASSLLDSSYYQERLRSCFAGDLSNQIEKAPEIGELDLFVTATDAFGAVSTVFDDLGHPIDIKNHRALFKLAYRGSRKNDFNGPPEVYAKLARMTSCFPVAFEPVPINEDDPSDKSSFFRWGKLHHSSVYLDGGILNNKPFTSTIDAIAGRTATREVERFLIYVEPNPERFEQTLLKPIPPTVIEAGVTALISIPGYQSIAGDLQKIQTHNERAARLIEIFESIPKPVPNSTECISTTGIVGDHTKGCDTTAYYAARFVELRDAAVKAILDDEKRGRQYLRPMGAPEASTQGEESYISDKPLDSELDIRRSARILVQSFNSWPGEGLDTLKKYDIFFRMRRVKHLMDSLMRAEKAGVYVPIQIWESLNHVFKLHEITKAALISWLTKFDFGWKNLSARFPELDVLRDDEKEKTLSTISVEIWGKVEERMDEFLMAGISPPASSEPTDREDFYQSLQRILAETTSIGKGNKSVLYLLDDLLKASIVSLVDDSSTNAMGQVLRDEFCRFLEVDRQLFLVQIGSGFESTDLIRVVRFSPLDAQRGLSRGSVQSKVRGSELAAFGGFFSKAWRANDIMIGRLDGVCLLVECLLTKERLATLARRNTGKPFQISRSSLRRCFPRLEPCQLRDLTTNLNSYLSNAAKASDGEWNHLIDQLVAAAQNEIQADEWPTVIKCAIDQHCQWNQYRLNGTDNQGSFDPNNLVWERGKSTPDAVIVEAAATAISTGGDVGSYQPASQTPIKFFEQVPIPVMQELISGAAIRLGKSLLFSIKQGPRREFWARSWLYRLPFGWIAPAVYHWSKMQRTQSAMRIAINTALVTACVSSMVLAVIIPVDKLPIALSSSISSALHHWPFILIPLVVLLIWLRWFKE